MELEVERRDARQIVFARESRAFGQNALQPGNLRRIVAPRRQLGVQCLERRAHFHHLLDLLLRERGDGRAAPRLDGDDALGGQGPQRFAHRHARDAQFLGKAPLDQALTRRERTAQDALAQGCEDQLGERRMAFSQFAFGVQCFHGFHAGR